jgi:hypothetical protein
MTALPRPAVTTRTPSADSSRPGNPDKRTFRGSQFPELMVPSWRTVKMNHPWDLLIVRRIVGAPSAE